MNDAQIMVLELGSKGYTCAQILIIGALRLTGEENETLVRSMSALSQGGGNSGQMCGALTGGLCLLSMYTAKGNDFEQAMQEEALLMEALLTWFNEEVCANCDNRCDAILGLTDLNSSSSSDNASVNIGCTGHTTRTMRQDTCGHLLAKVWDKCLQLLQEHGIDPTMART